MPVRLLRPTRSEISSRLGQHTPSRARRFRAAVLFPPRPLSRTPGPLCAPGTTVELLCALDRVEGRKRFLKGTMHDATGTLLADGDCLFVIPRGPG